MGCQELKKNMEFVKDVYLENNIDNYFQKELLGEPKIF